MKALILFVACGLGLVAVTGAQEAKEKAVRPMRGMQQEAACDLSVTELVKDLELTGEQQAQLRTLKQSSMEVQKVLMAKMRELAIAQARLLNQEKLDEEALIKGTEAIGQARTEIAKIRIKQLIAVQKILTPEQRTKMREKMKAHQVKRGDGTRGPGPGPKGRKGMGKGQTPVTNTPPAVVPAT